MGLTHLGCPSCGGALTVAEGQRLVTCRYCGGRNLALIPDAIPRAVIELGVTAEHARAHAERYLWQAPVAPALRGRVHLQPPLLCYVPFYEFTATRIGSFRLPEETPPPLLRAGVAGEAPTDRALGLARQSQGKGQEETRVIQQGFTRVGPACDLGALGLERIPLERMRQEATGLALQPFDPLVLQSRATVFVPTKPPERFTEDLQFRVMVQADRTAVIEQRLTVLYYPVWLTRYRYLGRVYEIALDGVTGTILRGRAPVDIRPAVVITVAGLALAALCFGRPTHALLVGSGPGHWLIGTVGAVLGLTLGGAMALLIAVIGWSAFRQGGEIHLEPSTDSALLDPPARGGALASLGAGMAGRLVRRMRGSSWP